MRFRFWEERSLAELSPDEWESLCDGCGRCCLHKLQDEDTGEVFYTRVACRFLDLSNCRCREYGRRQEQMSDCLVLRPGDTAPLQWLPRSCAYRLLAEGRPLPPWHPLVTGRADEPRRRGKSACGIAIPEDRLEHPDQIQEFLIPWPE